MYQPKPAIGAELNLENRSEASLVSLGFNLDKPLITLIIPVYNTYFYLEKCICSITSQNFDRYEVVLIDDGSTDGSSQLCDDLACDNPKIRVFHQKNSGVSSARNAGIELALGDYLWFCDSDDSILDGSLSILAHSIEQPRPAMVAFPVVKVDSKGNAIGRIPAPLPSNCSTLGPLQCNDELYPFGRIIRRDVVGDERFNTSLSLLEDRDFLYRVWWSAAGNVEVLSQPLYRYLVTREDSAVNSASVTQYVDATSVQISILEHELLHNNVMPAFELFAGFAIYTLSLIARQGECGNDYYSIRNELKEYSRYVSRLHGGLKLKYLLVLFCPALFNAMAYLKGRLKELSC